MKIPSDSSTGWCQKDLTALRRSAGRDCHTHRPVRNSKVRNFVVFTSRIRNKKMAFCKARLCAVLLVASYASVLLAEDSAKKDKPNRNSPRDYAFVEREWVGPGSPKSTINVSARLKWTVRLKPNETLLNVTDRGNDSYLVVYRNKEQTLVRTVDAAKGGTLLGPSAVSENISAVAAGVLKKKRRYILVSKEGVTELATPFSDDEDALLFYFADPSCVSVSSSEKWFAVGNSLGELIAEVATTYDQRESTDVSDLPIEKIIWFPDEKKLAVLSIAEFPERKRIEEEMRLLEHAKEERSDKYKKYYTYYWAKMYRRKSSVHVWDIGSGEKKKIIESDPKGVGLQTSIASIAIGKDGNTVYFASASGTVKFLKFPQTSLLCAVRTGEGAIIEDLAVSPDGKLLGCAYRNGRIRVIDAISGHILWDGSCKRSERLQSP
jgi:hypothetical protein